MKIKSSVKKLCKNCRLIKRNRQLRIICTNPKHKRRQN